MPELLCAPERTRLVEIGAEDVVGNLPALTLQELFPEAFPLDPEFRAMLLSKEHGCNNEMLFEFIFALAYVSQSMNNEEFTEEWEKDPLFRILVPLNRKACKIYTKSNGYALHKRAENERLNKVAKAKPDTKPYWTQPDNLIAKQALVHSIVKNLTEFFPSGQAIRNATSLFLNPHLSRRADELEDLLKAMVIILVYPDIENCWPLLPEQRNKIEPRIPKVINDLEELGKQFLIKS